MSYHPDLARVHGLRFDSAHLVEIYWFFSLYSTRDGVRSAPGLAVAHRCGGREVAVMAFESGARAARLEIVTRFFWLHSRVKSQRYGVFSATSACRAAILPEPALSPFVPAPKKRRREDGWAEDGGAVPGKVVARGRR